MKTDLFLAADSFFDKHLEYVTTDLREAPYGTEDNPFIRSCQIDGKSFRTIPEKLVLLLARHSQSAQLNYLVSPRMASKVTLPDSDIGGMHRHHYYELFGVLDGQLDMQMEHSHKRYFPGDFCLVNQSVFHSEIYSGDFSCIYISMRSDFFEELMSCKESSHFETFTQFSRRNSGEEDGEDSLDFTPIKSGLLEDNMRQVSNILSTVLTELLYRHTGYKDIVCGSLKRLFAHLQHTDNYFCVNTRYPAEKADVYHEALAYIHQNRRKLSRGELALAMNYNSNYLADIFRKNMGISLSSYIRDICMQEAARLLLNTDLPIHEIIGSIGYKNRTTFYQHFQEKYNVTPKEYRQSL